MAMRIATCNTLSLQVQTPLSKTSKALSKSYEKLSSGLRINNASDDPAGLALADKLKANSTMATVAIRNANDGISAISIADGALSQVADTLNRMLELAEEYNNGTYTADQKTAMNTEYAALYNEIGRVTSTTEFNGINLINSSSGSVSIELGVNGTSSTVSIQKVDCTTGSSGLNITNTLATTTISKLNTAVTTLSNNRATLGGSGARLEVAIGNLEASKETFKSAESSVRDVDIASEAAELTRLDILQQSATAILAQANQEPQTVLALIA